MDYCQTGSIKSYVRGIRVYSTYWLPHPPSQTQRRSSYSIWKVASRWVNRWFWPDVCEVTASWHFAGYGCRLQVDMYSASLTVQLSLYYEALWNSPFLHLQFQPLQSSFWNFSYFLHCQCLARSHREGAVAKVPSPPTIDPRPKGGILLISQASLMSKLHDGALGGKDAEE